VSIRYPLPEYIRKRRFNCVSHSDVSIVLVAHAKILTRNSYHFCRPSQKVVVFSKNKIADVRSWIEEVYKYNGNLELLQQFLEWNPPKFPITGHTLVERKVPGNNRI
jgi:hypothetical protein